MEGLDLVDHFSEELCLEASDRITMPCLDLVSPEGGDQPIGPHSDVTMDAPDRKGQSYWRARLVPFLMPRGGIRTSYCRLRSTFPHRYCVNLLRSGPGAG